MNQGQVEMIKETEMTAKEMLLNDIISFKNDYQIKGEGDSRILQEIASMERSLMGLNTSPVEIWHKKRNETGFVDLIQIYSKMI